MRPRSLLGGLAAVLSLALGGALAPEARATTLYDNGTYTGMVDGAVTSGHFSVIDNFALSDAAHVDGLHWTQHDGETDYVATELTFFRSSPTGANLIGSYTVAATRTQNATGTLYGQYVGYDYTVTGLDLQLAAGTYWVEFHTVFANESYGALMDETTNGLLAGRRQRVIPEPGLALINSPRNTPFQVLGSFGSGAPASVPEPASIALVGLGAAALGRRAARRRAPAR